MAFCLRWADSGFTPSSESYAVAVSVYEQMREQLATVGVRDDAAMDLWTAVLTGLADQQISNDPGGDRWTRLVDRAVDDPRRGRRLCRRR